MRNQPLLAFDEDWGNDRGPAVEPRWRLFGITSLFLMAMLGIGARVVWVQTVLADQFIAPWNELTTEERPLPSRDGRILSRDGVVLAEDQVTYDIAVHYRRLENPPHPLWINTQLRKQLTREERRDPRRVESVVRELVHERQKLLERLADAAAVTVPQLEEKSQAIQRRVERMKAEVERQRQSGRPTFENPDRFPAWGTFIDRVLRELTTPPDRFSEEPIVLKEEVTEHVVLSDVPLEVAARIQTYPHQFQGVVVRSIARRTYPLEDVAMHVVGVRRSDNPGAEGSQPQGISGVERVHNSSLSGTPGVERNRRSRQGESIDSEVSRPPTDGRDITLTIHSRLQQAAEALLDEAVKAEGSDPRSQPTGAVLVAMDVWTGSVLALAQSPRPRATDLTQPSAARWSELINDPRRPLFPRITQAALPAGSVFKVITAMAALEQGAMTPEESIHCRGYLDRTDQSRCLIYRQHGYGHGETRLADALSQSCNVYFFEAARRLGADPLVDWADRCGIGQPTGIDLPGESFGNLPRPEKPGNGERWYPGTTLQLAVGQGALLVTPLQIVRLLAAVANGGYLVTPRVVVDAATVSEPPRKIPGLDAPILEAIRAGLEQAVSDPRGTARGLKMPMLTVAGKTGTAEVNVREDHAWFAGYAPVAQPRVAIVVLVEHGGSAGKVAIPVVREFLVKMLQCGELQPD